MPLTDGGQLHAERLRVHDDGEDDDGREQVHDVGQLRAVQRLLERAGLILAGEQEMEEGDDGALELRAAASGDRGRREGLPDDGIADVGGDEQRDTAAEAPALLKELVEELADEGRDEQLSDDDDAHEQSNGLDIAVHAGQNVRGRLDDGDEQAEELLRAFHDRAVFLVAVIDVDELDTH